MKEDYKENTPVNARRSLSLEEDEITKHKRSISSDKEVISQEKRSLSKFESSTNENEMLAIRIKHKRKRDACNNKLPLSERTSSQSENTDDNKETPEVVVRRRPRKKIRPMREQVIDLTLDLSDNSSDESSSINVPSPPPIVKKPAKQKSPEPESTACKYCGEAEDKITECSAPLEGASKEEEMLNFNEIQASWKINDELPCVKLVNFRVFDKARHLLPFDGKLIKAQDGLYISGFVKPYDSDKTELSDLFPCEELGPITDWWFEGFDLNDESSLGLTTESAHYYLEKPMAEYAPFMASVKEKIFVAKIVIDVLENVADDEELSYEALLNTLKDKVPPEGIPAVTEEVLLKNGVFVCEQIQSYDSAADKDEKLMSSMPCMEELSRKVDFDFGAKSDEDVNDDDDDSDVSICMIGDIERPILDFIDLDEIDSSDDDGNGVRRGRRRRRKYYQDFDWLYEDDEAETKRGRKRRRKCRDLDDSEYENDDDEERERKPRNRKRYHKGPMRHKIPVRRVMVPTKTIKLSKATTTPLVENIFESFFSGEIMRNYTRDYSDTAPGLTTNRVFSSTKSYDDYNLITPCVFLTKLEDMGINWEEYKIRFARDWSDEEQSPVSELERKDEQPHESVEAKVEPRTESPASELERKDEQPHESVEAKVEPRTESPASELERKDEQPHESVEAKVEPRTEQVHENEDKMETEDAQVPANEAQRKPEDTQVLENEQEKMDTEDSPVLETEKKPEGERSPENGEKDSELKPVEPEVEMEDLKISLPVVREFQCIELKSLEPDVVKFYVDKNKKPSKNNIISLDSSDDESDSEHSSKRKRMSEKPEENLDDAGYTVPEFRQMLKRKKTRRNYPIKIKWIDRPYKEIDGYEYYKKVQINDSTVSVGDFISTYHSNSIGCIKYMFENIDEERLFHIHWFTRSMDTILAEVGHPNELFESAKCEDVLMEEFYQIVSVKFVPSGSDWFETGNMNYVNQLNQNEDPSRFLYYQKRFCEKTGRFTDAEPESSCSLIDCNNCERQRKLVQREIPCSEEKSKFDKEHKMFALKMVRWRDEEYRIGSCVFLTPGSILKPESKKVEEVDDNDEDYDEDLYPEKYRKPSHFKSVLDEDVLPDPFEIGYICEIWSRKQDITKSADVKLKLKKFYRPHNTSLSQDEIRTLDLNLLYCSDEECTVDFSKVQGKCYVTFKENLTCPLDEWAQKGPYRFYFSRAYNSQSKEFESPSSSAKKIGNLENDDEKDQIDVPQEYPPISRPLRSLDVFAGCGGLTEGLHQAKITECCWAIEKDTAAAKAFKSNYPDATVFTDDCNLLLSAVVNRGEKMWAGKKLPQKGEVEVICGGPPCQGFSGMNRFRFGQWSKFNNSLVVTFLSYCDYYRPRFFVMENVRNFVSHEKSVVLKLTLNCLVKMGYQVAFGVLQSGRFGIPQSRRRLIILAAAPGETLPLHPEITHTFALTGFETVSVDDTKYVTNAKWTAAAPYRMVTVYDALSDLPPIKEGDSQVEKPYCRNPITHFQRQLRTYNGETEEETILRDHISKSLSALVIKRLSFIPKKVGCDWRDLPNIVVKLSDGTLTKKLQYTHHDAKQGKASNGSLRGVCSCANNEKCRSEFRQSNTIIPWCLPHTSNRHNHWHGLYGRLGWNEYFQTVVTNPEPMGKQGRVVHPEEDRVISVKECARSQGFPDRYKFYGYILDKYRQIGNAVAPPLAKAVGLEIRKCIHEKESKVQVIN